MDVWQEYRQGCGKKVKLKKRTPVGNREFQDYKETDGTADLAL